MQSFALWNCVPIFYSTPWIIYYDGFDCKSIFLNNRNRCLKLFIRATVFPFLENASVHVLNQSSRIIWKHGRKMCRQLYFIVDTNEFTVERRRNTHDCLRQRGCGSVPRFFLLFRFRTHLCIREGRANSYGALIKNETIVHRVYHFPRFFATQLSSPAGVGSFFRSYDSRPGRASSCLMGRAEEEKALHYNYPRKKV